MKHTASHTTHAHDAHHGHHHGDHESGNKVKDPVCGMMVDPAAGKPHMAYKGHEYYFCSDSCHGKFKADPEKYLTAQSAAAPAIKGAQYTCPMHPEIIRDEPGSCPICGMALEPVMPSLDDGPNPELVDFTRRFWVSAICSIPLLIVTMGPMLGLPIREWIGEQRTVWLEFLLATPVVLWAALPFFKRGVD